MIWTTLRSPIRPVRLPLYAILGGLAMLGAFDRRATGEPANPLESIPSEPFAMESGDSLNASDLAARPLVSPKPEEFAIKPQNSKKESFSLWDFFSRFFELGAPGDPNHPDKLRLTVGPTFGYDDNVLTTKNDPIASATAGLTGALAYNIGTERLKIASGLTLGTTYYDNRPNDKTDYTGTLSGNMAYSITRRLQVTGSASLAYLSQPNPTLVGGVSRFQGDYWSANLGFDVSYSLKPRLSIHAGFDFNGIQYTDEVINQGSGFYQQTYTLGLDYLVTPRVTLTAEYRYNPLSYYEADQDSTGHILTFGFNTTITPKLTWTLQGGAEARMLNNVTQGGASEYLGPFLETDLQYKFAPGSFLVATLRYGTEPSGVAGISVRETLRGSLGLTYAITGRLTSNVGISYEHDKYDQPGDQNDFSQVYYTASVGLSYKLNPAFSVNVNYVRSAVQSDVESDEYTRGVTTLGLEIIF